MKTNLDIVATAAIRKSSWLTRCKVPKCDLIVLHEMYDTARKIEDNLEMYWCLSKNDKKVTDFRKEMDCVEDAKQAFLIAHESLHSNLQSASLPALCETQHKEQHCISTLLHWFGLARSFLPKLAKQFCG